MDIIKELHEMIGSIPGKKSGYSLSDEFNEKMLKHFQKENEFSGAYAMTQGAQIVVIGVLLDTIAELKNQLKTENK